VKPPATGADGQGIVMAWGWGGVVEAKGLVEPLALPQVRSGWVRWVGVRDGQMRRMGPLTNRS
jgi:hypothetical protein